MNAVLVFYNIAAGGIAPVISAETSSVRLRAKSNSIGFVFNGLMSWAFTFFVPYMFNVDEGNWGGKTAFFFAGLAFISAVVVYLEVPEMNKRTYVQLDQMFENRVRTRHFEKYRFEVSQTSNADTNV